ncbi:MAG: hypothetical protein IT335_00315 [Thermomicrobiales bacterium]|jgi:hypothetical protein|nr:hypothetical protein [Thermomicrobiales bacterium]
MGIADSLSDILILFLVIAGTLILINGIIDLGIAGLRTRIDALGHRLSSRANGRQKTKASTLPPR